MDATIRFVLQTRQRKAAPTSVRRTYGSLTPTMEHPMSEASRSLSRSSPDPDPELLAAALVVAEASQWHSDPIKRRQLEREAFDLWIAAYDRRRRTTQ